MYKRKITLSLEGCEKKIRQACAAELSEKDWCDIWAKAKSEALEGKVALLSALLPIVARKMPEAVEHSGEINVFSFDPGTD